MGKGEDRRLTFGQNFMCGGLAGVGSRSITSPLDVVKILFQVGTKDTHGGFFDAFKQIYKNEGLKAFWKGNGVACLRLFPYNAIQFAFVNEFQRLFANKQTGKTNPLLHGVSGSTAGIIATLSVYPLDLVKTRLTIQKHGHGEKLYNGILDCITKVYKQEGVAALFAGAWCSVVGVIPFAGFTFMSYSILELAWGKPKSKLTPFESFLNGCASGAFAQTFSFPFDTIRKKMQAQSRHGAMKADVQFNGMTDCFKQTIKQKGVLALWAGTLANLAKVAPYAGFIFAIFESSKKFYLYTNGYSLSPWKEIHTPGVDQSWTPTQVKEFLKNKPKTA